MENESHFVPKKPIIEDLDLSPAETWNGKEGFRDYIIQRLKDLGLYTPDLVFSGFDGNKIKVVKKFGTYMPEEKMIYGSSEAELADESRLRESALDYIEYHKKAALAVYDGTKLTVSVPYQYTPLPGNTLKEALVAIFKIK